jgi:serine/threonine protein kinase
VAKRALVRTNDPRVVVQRVEHSGGAINVIVQLVDAPTQTVIDVAQPDDEATQIRKLPSGTTPPPIVHGLVNEGSQERGLVLAPGGRLGKYELKEKLGQGTFGYVFVAHDTNLDRDVAIKVLMPQHATNPEIVKRFILEARAASRVAHPGVIMMLDCGVVETSIAATAFIAMELLHGETLADRLKRSGKLRPDLAIEITRQIACALDAAHRANVLHRDLKTENIFIVPDPAVPSNERVKVLDFGLAKVGESGMTNVQTVFGTPRYMSPEQCRSSGQIDQRSDIYSLGCILFELVTGRTPFDGELREIVGQHLRTTAPRARTYTPEITAALDNLIAEMLAKDPADRPQTMASVQHALHQMGAISPGAGETMMPMAAQLIGFQTVPPSQPHAFEPAPSSQPRAFEPAPPSQPHVFEGPTERARMAPPPEPRVRHPFRYAALAAVLVVAGAIALVARNRGNSTASRELTPTQDGPPVVLVGKPVTN